MGVLLLILVIIIMGALWSLPLYLCTNLVLWLFGIEFHLTLFQAFGVCLLASVIKNLLGKGE